jgi:uncharacterized protein (TIGR02466 family)
MIHSLFPTLIYTELDPGFVDIGNRWFDKATFYNGSRVSPGLKTTLVIENYTPSGAEVSFDCTKQPEWLGWEQFITYHVRQFLREQRLKPYDVIIENTWLNEYSRGGGQERHLHYGYTISGIYYTQVPKDTGKIMFYSEKNNGKPFLNRIEEDTPGNCPIWWIPVETGNIVLFSSDTIHSVPTFEFDEIRRSISFDIVLK